MAALVALSLFRPLFDPRYLSVLWGPSLPLLGIGLARLRPLGSLAVLVLAAATVAMLVTTTRADWRETAGWLNARLERSDQVVINSPDYLVLLHYGNDRLVAATHVLNSGGPPWFWGTAAYPRGALVRRVVDANGTIYVFAGDFVHSVTRLVLPPGYRPYHPRCDSGICVTPYRR